MLREVPLRIQDADVRRVSKPSLRATLVARLVLPADLHLLLDLALLSEHHEVRKGKGPRDARHEIARGSVQFRPALPELLHGALRVLGRQEKEEDRANAVQVARGRRLAEVLLRGPPARGVDDRAGSLELMEFLLRRSEVDQHHLSSVVLDYVHKRDFPMA